MVVPIVFASVTIICRRDSNLEEDIPNVKERSNAVNPSRDPSVGPIPTCSIPGNFRMCVFLNRYPSQFTKISRKKKGMAR
jgi:hypothetical protein